MKENNKNILLVVGINHYNTLNVLRYASTSCNLYGIVGLVTSNINNIKPFVSTSRYTKEYYFIQPTNDSIIDFIIGKVKKYNDKKVYLLCTSDFTAKVIDDNYVKLVKYKNLHFPHANGNISKYQNKVTSKKLAIEIGFNIASGKLITKDDFVWDTFPAIVKPYNSNEGLKSDIEIVKNKLDYNIVINKLLSKGYNKLLVEEFIQNEDSNVVLLVGYRTQKKFSIEGVNYKIREYPLHKGSTGFAYFEPTIDEDIENKVKIYLETINYFGIFDLELIKYKGKFYFLECNFRIGALTCIVNKAGGSIFEDYLYGKNSKKIRKPFYFMIENMDFMNLLSGDLKFGRWLKDLIRSKYLLFFFWKDLRPSFAYVRRGFYHLFHGSLLKK